MAIEFVNAHGEVLVTLPEDTHSFDLSEEDLTGVQIKSMVLQMAMFIGSKLEGALFFETDLYWATFICADCRGTVFCRCDLTGAVFRGANLTDAVFDNCILSFEDGTNAACFDEADLSNCSFLGRNEGDPKGQAS